MIGVVTVTYNSVDVIPGFFRSFEEETAHYRLYVVDNNSTDATLKAIASHGNTNVVLLAQPDNRGVAVGNNIGARHALDDGCEYVVFLNNDTEFEPGLIDRLVASLKNNNADLLVPSIRYFDDPSKVWFEAAEPRPWLGNIPRALTPSHDPTPRRISLSSTCCVAVRRRVFERIGLMDEAFFLYFDDTDFFIRALRNDLLTLLDPTIVVRHKVSSLTGGASSLFALRHHFRSRAYYVRKHARGPARLVGLAATIASSANVAIRGPQRRLRIAALASAVVDGLRVPIHNSSV